MWVSEMNRELLAVFTHNFPGTLSLNQARVLSEVTYENVRDRCPGIRQLAESTGISRSTVGRIIVGFIHAGLLEDLRQSQDDGRVSHIRLTPKGHSVTFQHARAILEWKAKIFENKNV